MKKIIKRLLLLSVSILISAIFAELFLRYSPRLLFFSSANNITEPFLKIDDPVLQFVLKPNIRNNLFITNSQGFVGSKEYQKEIRDDSKRILTLGDSLTQGGEKLISFPRYLEEILNKESYQNIKWEVINAGVSGYNHLQVARYFERLLKDDWQCNYVIYGICPNDILANVKIIDDTGSLVKSVKIEDYSKKTRLKDFELVKLLVKISDILFSRLNKPALMYKKREYYSYCKAVSGKYYDEEAAGDFEKSLDKIIKVAHSNNVKPIFVLFPQALDYEDEFIDITEYRRNRIKNYIFNKNVLFIDTHNIFTRDNIYKLFCPSDPAHPNAAGHKMVAQYIFNQIDITKY
ncbi:MAG: SGNH/GDSL hydrolase family protein [Candidatus Hydrogenedentota bacterium]